MDPRKTSIHQRRLRGNNLLGCADVLRGRQRFRHPTCREPALSLGVVAARGSCQAAKCLTDFRILRNPALLGDFLAAKPLEMRLIRSE
jgi:hypothetical protein